MKINSKLTSIALASLALAASLGAQKLQDKKGLTLAVARQLAAAAEAAATQTKFNMVVAVVDDGGNLLCLERMDDAQIGSVEVAQVKAHTAIAFKRPTKAFQDALAGGNMGVLKLPGIMAAEGGIPIVVDGKIIGAIGVSGGTSPQDGAAAQAALDQLPKILGQ